MKQAAAIALLLSASGIARAQNFIGIPAYHGHRNPIVRVGHYMKTHKELLVMDAMTATAFSLDVIASNRCQRIGRDLSLEDGLPNQCVETNSWLGPHPSGAKTWGLGFAYIGGFVALNHAGHWAAQPGVTSFHAFWIPNAFISGMLIGDIQCDWHEGNVLAAHRSGIIK